MKKALLVVGMHRSGTSALAGALSMLGVDLGADLLPPSGENELGFFELKEVASFHDSLLLSGGRTWDLPSPLTASWLDRFATQSSKAELANILERNFTDSDLWAVKDPRLCQLLPLWREVLADLSVDVAIIQITRDPDAVAASLARRNGFSTEKSGYLWLDHNLSAERDSRGAQRAYLSYEDLLYGKMATLRSLSDQLGLSWPNSSESTVAGVEGFLTADLDHGGDPFPGKAGEYGRWNEIVTKLTKLLQEFQNTGSSEDTTEAFDSLSAQQDALLSGIDPLLLTHCTDLVLGSGGLRELQDSVNAAERALETAAAYTQKAAAYTQKIEMTLETVQEGDRQSKKHLGSLEKHLMAQCDQVEKVDAYARALESELDSKANLIRELEDEIRKQADSTAEHERALQEADQYSRSLEREIERHLELQQELAGHTQSLEREIEKHQNHQKELASYAQDLVSRLEGRQNPAPDIVPSVEPPPAGGNRRPKEPDDLS